jgi:citrate lyase beta subunit
VCQAANEIGADSIVMDCEDGVAANMKDMARQTISLMLDGERLETAAAAAAAAQQVRCSNFTCLQRRGISGVPSL